MFAKVLKYNPHHDKRGRFASSEDTANHHFTSVGGVFAKQNEAERVKHKDAVAAQRALDVQNEQAKAKEAEKTKEAAVPTIAGTDFATAKPKELKALFATLGVNLQHSNTFFDLNKKTLAVANARKCLKEAATAFEFMRDNLGFKLADHKIAFQPFVPEVKDGHLMNTPAAVKLAFGVERTIASAWSSTKGRGTISLGGTGIINGSLHNVGDGPVGSWTIGHPDWPVGVSIMIHEVGHVMASDWAKNKAENRLNMEAYAIDKSSGGGNWKHVQKQLSTYGSTNKDEFLAELNVLNHAYPGKVPKQWQDLADSMKTGKKSSVQKGYSQVLKAAVKSSTPSTQELEALAKSLGMTLEQIYELGVR